MGYSSVIISLLLKYARISCFLDSEVFFFSLSEWNRYENYMDYIDQVLIWEIILKFLYVWYVQKISQISYFI